MAESTKCAQVETPRSPGENNWKADLSRDFSGCPVTRPQSLEFSSNLEGLDKHIRLYSYIWSFLGFNIKNMSLGLGDVPRATGKMGKDQT